MNDQESRIAATSREAAWLDPNERYRILVDAITDYAVYMLDAGGHVASWNPGAANFKGYREDEILGAHFSRFYTPEDQATELPQRALREAAEEGRFENEGWRVRKDGSRFWAHVVIDPIRDKDGTLLGFAKVTRDLTERREAQQALDQARQALFQAQKIEALGQLTGGIAHDFNNLLMVVLNCMDLLSRRLEYDARLTPLIENARQAALRGASLTQRMLAFARKQELKFEAIDPAEAVRGVADMLNLTVDSRIRIELDLPHDMPHVRGDANQLETALLNLVVNARDAMPGGGTVRISGRAGRAVAGNLLSLTPGDYVRITVADTGIGMDAQTLARAREPFFTTKGTGKGTGLGLSMVQGLMEQSGGGLDITSEPGKGTEVTLWLPASGEASATKSTASAGAFRKPKAGRVLLVDDDGLVLVTAKAMLEELGLSAWAVNSATAALDTLKEGETFTAVISDHAMPGMSGLKLAREVKARWPDLPFVLMTGYAEFEEEEARGIVTLRKPFTQGSLRELIGELGIG